ncbi:PAAR domain-containing protein [Pseudomonas sp. NPDC089395]|uniref:PAAR domain-containing protein n=1 Tax=Pseudomonas sp. NPDC089395 TaxID=3364460 RepID=UPI00382B5B56
MSGAARFADPIEHSSALSGLLAGLAIGAGAVLVGIAVIGTGGLGAAALVAMVGAGAATGAGIGQLLGSLSFAQRETGFITSGSGNVHINGQPAARAHADYAACTDHAGVSRTLAQGSCSVYINGLPAARVGDRTVCGARISAGSTNVFIGGGTETTDEISPELAGWLDGAVLGVGLASAIALVGPAMALWGLFGGMLGGGAGYQVGGERYGEGSDEQKLMAFGGAFIVGGLAARYRLQPNGGLGTNLNNTKLTKRMSAPIVSNAKKTTAPASFGKAASDDYKATFFEAHPEQSGKVVVHHAVEQQVQRRYPGLVKNEEMHSLENLRGIPKEVNSEVHLSIIRKEWNRFYREIPKPTKQQLLDKATEIDDMLGTKFSPPIR